MRNRRQFVRSALSLPLAFAGAPLIGGLTSGGALAADVSDYRALVCVFLFGGMDCHDTVIPFDTASYQNYAGIRSSLLNSYAALPGGSNRTQSDLLALQTLSAQSGGREFALPAEMSGLHNLFTQGNAAIVGNVGPLLEPTTRSMFDGNVGNLPARLFSHNDQQSTWMSFAPEGSQLGWGGLFGDAAINSSANDQGIFSQISLAGNSVFLTGDIVSPYQISAGGVPSIRLIDATRNQFPVAIQNAVRDHFAATGIDPNNLFEKDLIDLSRISLDANDTLDAALVEGSSVATAFPASPLGGQLRAVAETIAVRETLGAKRQVFFVALGGFDTHSAQAADLPGLQRDIGDSLSAFFTATQELGLEDQVTAFTAADFGRTLTVNGDGTDHGWGSHHFVVGGAVKGGDIYGAIPEAELGHAQDAGNGRLIPTTSVEQFAEPLGRWFGLTESELQQALPRLSNFPSGQLNFL